jgi:hypothetical protein
MFRIGDTVKLKKNALRHELNNYWYTKSNNTLVKYFEGNHKITRIVGDRQYREAEFDFPSKIIEFASLYDEYWYTSLKNLIRVGGDKNDIECRDCKWKHCPGAKKAKQNARRSAKRAEIKRKIAKVTKSVIALKTHRPRARGTSNPR